MKKKRSCHRRGRRPQCLCCRDTFTPDHRNQGRQRYCSKPTCQQASKHASQQRWLLDPANRDYFRGGSSTERVREWRKKQAGKPKADRRKPPQGNCPDCNKNPQSHNPLPEKDLAQSVKQDSLSLEWLVIVALVSHLTGHVQQETIDQIIQSMAEEGRQIVGLTPTTNLKPKDTDAKAFTRRTTAEANAPPI